MFISLPATVAKYDRSKLRHISLVSASQGTVPYRGEGLVTGMGWTVVVGACSARCSHFSRLRSRKWGEKQGLNITWRPIPSGLHQPTMTHASEVSQPPKTVPSDGAKGSHTWACDGHFISKYYFNKQWFLCTSISRYATLIVCLKRKRHLRLEKETKDLLYILNELSRWSCSRRF